METQNTKERFNSYDSLLQQVASNLRRIRIAKKLTQEDMRDFGFDYRHYQRIESGKYSLSLHTLFRLSVAVEVDIDEFFR